VPLGAGLSSSAAIEVAVASALIDCWGLSMEATDVARLCQRAENEFVGARCGIMDQFIACHARAGHALLLDCRSLESRVVPLPAHVRLVACNTMVRHSIAGGEYNRRRAECEQGVAALAARVPGIRSLRDVDLALLQREGGALPDVIRRRCRHVVTENARVAQAAGALARGDLDALGGLMAGSHRSLREDYEVSCTEIELMVQLASDCAGVFGSRLTGGGFGGCTVNLVDQDAVDEFRLHVSSRYEARTGRRPDIYVTEAGRGAEQIA
jgi:galactokinase